MPPPDLPSDEELIEAINDGDSAAFEALYYRYRDWVVRLACRFTGHQDDALDVLQEVFAYLVRKTPNLRLSARMTTFLYPAVKHWAILAKNKRTRLGTGQMPADDQMPAAAPADPRPDHSSRVELAQVMEALPEDHREIVLMRFVDDMSLAEIAIALSVPEGTVKSRLHRALERLRDDPRTRQYFES